MSLSDLINYDFILRAALAGSLIAVLCAILGVFLVLRRLSLIGDGLSHVTFGSVAFAMFLNVSSVYVTLAAVPLVMLSSLGILKLTQKARVFGDAAIGIVSSLGIAVGIILASMSGGLNVDLFSYLFGNILAVSREEVCVAAVLFAVVLTVVLVFYNDLFAMTYDEDLARISGIRTERINIVLVLLSALVIVLAMKVVGIMLVSALMILPSVAALQCAKGFKTTLALAVLYAVVSVLGGIVASFTLNIPTGGAIILINFLIFFVSFSLKKMVRRSALRRV